MSDNKPPVYDKRFISQIIDSSLTTDYELQRICDILGIDVFPIGFKDVVIDNFRNYLMQNGLDDSVNYSMILNLQDYGEGNGTHWVALFCPKGADYNLYFDSFGQPPPSNIEDISEDMGRKLYYQTNQIQKLQSGGCGQYCVLFLYYMNFYKPKLDRLKVAQLFTDKFTNYSKK